MTALWQVILYFESQAQSIRNLKTGQFFFFELPTKWHVLHMHTSQCTTGRLRAASLWLFRVCREPGLLQALAIVATRRAHPFWSVVVIHSQLGYSIAIRLDLAFAADRVLELACQPANVVERPLASCQCGALD